MNAKPHQPPHSRAPARRTAPKRPEPPPLGVISSSREYVQHLQSLVHPYEALKSAGHLLQQLTESELEQKKRCERCCRAMTKKDRKGAPFRGKGSVASTARCQEGGRPSSSSAVASTAVNNEEDLIQFDDINTEEDHGSQLNYMSPLPRKEPPEPIMRCKFHPGRVADKRWTCCNGNIFTKPCQGEPNHLPRHYTTHELRDNWRFHRTTSPPPQNPQIRLAVALDCEMGVAESGETELIRLSVVDYFSREVLIDSLVYPDAKMTHYNTRFSGVTAQAMKEARRSGTCIFGRANARKAVWKFVGPETIVIGHSVKTTLTHSAGFTISSWTLSYSKQGFTRPNRPKRLKKQPL